jgi:hypothetical protein
MVQSDSITPARVTLPQGYRQGILTAITVFLGFSLYFLRYWSMERPGEWTKSSVASAVITGAGIVAQLFALFRSLDVRDDDCKRYTVTVRIFLAGVVLVAMGVLAAIWVVA